MSDGCVFCERIAAGDYIACTGSGVDGHPYVVRFPPLNPVTPGHMLFVPSAHHASSAVGQYTAGIAMTEAARYVADEGIDANIITSIGAAATQTVMHTHLHVVPRREGDGLALPWTGQHA